MTLPVFGNPLSLSQIQGEFGGSGSIGLSGYYAGNGLVSPGTVGYPTGGGAVEIPSSGTISIANFFGASSASSSIYEEYVYFYTPGTETWTVPAGVTELTYWIVGGGGRGGSATLGSPATGEAFGGGGGGANIIFGTKAASELSGSTLTITVGAGGGYSPGNISTVGQASSISGFTGGILTANPGVNGGNASATNNVVNAGGGASGNGNAGDYGGGGYNSIAQENALLSTQTVPSGLGQCFAINGKVYTFGRGGAGGGGGAFAGGYGNGGSGASRADNVGTSKGGNGSNGVVIIRYKKPYYVTGFSNVGSFSYIVPPNVYILNLLVSGGGGKGGRANGAVATSTGGGGGGGEVKIIKYNVTPGQNLSITVGAGGTTDLPFPQQAGSSSLNGGVDGLIQASGGFSGDGATDGDSGSGGTNGNGNTGSIFLDGAVYGGGFNGGTGGGSCNGGRWILDNMLSDWLPVGGEGIYWNRLYYITATTSGTNAITCNYTKLLPASTTPTLTGYQAVVFYGTGFGNIVPGTTYYIRQILSATSFTISATNGGPEFSLSSSSGNMSMKIGIYGTEEFLDAGTGAEGNGGGATGPWPGGGGQGAESNFNITLSGVDGTEGGVMLYPTQMLVEIGESPNFTINTNSQRGYGLNTNDSSVNQYNNILDYDSADTANEYLSPIVTGGVGPYTVTGNLSNFQYIGSPTFTASEQFSLNDTSTYPATGTQHSYTYTGVTTFGSSTPFRIYVRSPGNSQPYFASVDFTVTVTDSRGVSTTSAVFKLKTDLITSAVPAIELESIIAGTGTASVTARFNTDGTISKLLSPAGGIAIGPSNWYTPTTGGIGNSYWIKFVRSTGSFWDTGLTNNTLYQLSANREVKWTATVSVPGNASVKNALVYYYIYSDSGGTNIYNFGQITAYAEVSA